MEQSQSTFEHACMNQCQRHKDANRIQDLTLSGSVLSFAAVAAAVCVAVSALERRGVARTVSELISIGGLQLMVLAAAAVIAALVAETRKEVTLDRSRQYAEIAIAFVGTAALMVVTWNIWKLAVGQGLEGARPSMWGLGLVAAFSAVAGGMLASEAATNAGQCATHEASMSVLPLARSQCSQAGRC